MSWLQRLQKSNTTPTLVAIQPLQVTVSVAPNDSKAVMPDASTLGFSRSVRRPTDTPKVEASTRLAPKAELCPPDDLKAGTSKLWPYGDGWADAEIDAFTGRVLRLQGLGVDLLKAEGLAEMLLKRDRDADGRRMCAECSNLAGRQCRSPQSAGLGLPIHRTIDVSPIRFMLQRCEGFAP